MHLCPVCGYDRLDEPPTNFSICPSCGTEFGYDDAFAPYAQLRARWMQGGALWWSTVDPCPENWDPVLQVQVVTSGLWRSLRVSNDQAGRIGIALDRLTLASEQQVPFSTANPLSFSTRQMSTPQAA